jgi:hypothetical protein
VLRRCQYPCRRTRRKRVLEGRTYSAASAGLTAVATGAFVAGTVTLHDDGIGMMFEELCVCVYVFVL